jgi:hypothetical protein
VRLLASFGVLLMVLGATGWWLSTKVLSANGVADFLDRNLTDVVILDVEDYVKPKDLKKALIDADLFDRVLRATTCSIPQAFRSS